MLTRAATALATTPATLIKGTLLQESFESRPHDLNKAIDKVISQLVIAYTLKGAL